MRSNEIDNWVKYLEDTRNDMAYFLLSPIESTLKNSLTPEEKVNRIQITVDEFYDRMREWDVKKYGINIP